MCALHNLEFYPVHNGGDSLDEGYLLKFKLIDAKFELGVDTTEVFISIHLKRYTLLSTVQDNIVFPVGQGN